MARKNLLAGLDGLGASAGTDAGLAHQGGQNAAPTSYPMRGAGKSLVRSLDELARQADKFLEGETIVELDPALVDVSFVKDRLSLEGEAFDALVAAIAERGQDTPILVRPKADGRYQVVFGHRRLAAARKLGRPVRAIVKSVDDRAHVIAQGQENSARSDLSFAERAIFARSLLALGHERDVIMAALSANAAAVSKMLSVTERIDQPLLEAIGAAPSVGRERWVELSQLLVKPDLKALAEDLVTEPGFAAESSDQRFERVMAAVKSAGKPQRKTAVLPRKNQWQSADKALAAEFSNTGRACTLSLKAKNAGAFGDFLSSRMEALYSEFLAEKAENAG